MPADPDAVPAAPLQGHELVVHVFVAADGAPADHRHLQDLWRRCVDTFALDDAVADLPHDWPAGAPAVDEGDALLAVRSGRGPGVHQVVARRVHDVLCLSLVLAPTDGTGWVELEERWEQVRRPPTRGVLGSVRILQARLADPGAGLDPATLAPVLGAQGGTWRAGILRAEPPLGPFAVWEAGDPAADQPTRDGRVDRRLVVLAPADRDDQLSAWTWSRGDVRLTPFGRYLLHAAKVRYELRVRGTSPGRALRKAVEETTQQLEPLVGAGRLTRNAAVAARLARLRALEIQLRRVRVWLADLRTTVQIADRNMAAYAGRDRSAGLFADDRDLAGWLDGQLERDLAYLDGPTELARTMIDAVAPLVPQRPLPEDDVEAPGRDNAGVVLTGAQKKQLIGALVRAYQSYAGLSYLLTTELDRNLAAYAAPGPLPLVLHQVIEYAEAEGWTAELVTGAALGNPGNPQLRQLIDSGQLDDGLAVGAALKEPTGAVQELLPQAGILDEDTRPELEHIVRIAAAFQNVVPFATKLLQTAGRVCWVKVTTASGRSSGTGFLVGPDLVLTNHHVLEDVIDGRTPPTAVRCVFDYHIRADGTPDDGVPIGLVAEDWLVAASPASPVDEQADPAGPPNADELDYALVRLAGKPGLAALPGGRGRGWHDLLAPPPELTTQTPLLIVQHPDDHPLKLAIDTDGVLEVNANKTRFRYGVNTVGGSSGSPCLTFDLALVGLHHSGTKNRTFQRNEGIPVAAIAEHLRAGGHAAALGA